MNILDMTPQQLAGQQFTLEDLPTRDGRVEVWETPRPHLTYCLGADFAYGIEGRDYDAALIMVKGDGKPRQVAELHGHWGERFDRVLYAAASYFGDAFIVGERQVGLPTLRRLWSEFGYRALYFERSEKNPTRPPADNLGHPKIYDDFTMRNLRRAVMDGEFEIRSTTLWDQMQKLQFYAKGEEAGVTDRARDEALRVKLPGGGSPDLVMALAYAWLSCREVVHYAPPKPKYEKGTLGDVLGHELLEGQSNGQPGNSWRRR